MKKIITTITALCCMAFSYAQTDISAFAQSSQNGNWWNFHENTAVQTEGFFERHQQSMGYDDHYSFEKINEKRDELGMTHSRYIQKYKGIKIEGAQFILHSVNNKIKKANGRLVNGINKGIVPALTFEAALNIAKAQIETEAFYWEVPNMEILIKDIKNDPNATFYPENELVFVDKGLSQNGDNYRLAYKIDLFYQGLHDHSTLFVDAINGDIILNLDGCHEGIATGTATTKYHGIQSITTDSVSATKYVLRDNSRGGGIETWNAQNSTNVGTAVIFEDTDNNWNNFNPQKDEVATDIHWGTAQTYDYYLNVHSRNSLDDQGMQIVSYAHYDQAWFNAAWNGIFTRYGDGNGNPLTSIDVVGHELTHGVTDFSADLVYANESGALNESFSDIFGSAIEYYARPDSFKWEIGVLDFKLRDMADPNSYGQPDTYLGTAWYVGTQDNGGVHINSGVQNYWFYLLATGGSGVNDLGSAFQVDSFGINKTAEIAYRNLTNYLTPTSNYYDARRGSIEAAADIYGACSYEVRLISKAWHAVGIGSDTLSSDLEVLEAISPLSDCAPSSQETLSFSFTYHQSGCDSTIDAGETIVVGYRINNSTAVLEYMWTANTVSNKDIITYTFNQTHDFSASGIYNIDFFVSYNGDFMPENDTIRHSVKVLEQIVLEDSIGFEVGSTPTESIFYNLSFSNNSVAVPAFIAKNSGFRGLWLSGKGARLPNIDIPQSESDNFVINPAYGSSICMCVDASNWNNVTLEFDLKQTYSQIYSNFMGIDPPELVSSLRVTVNGAQIGSQYHPDTYVDDPFVRQYVSLDQYAGQQFELCLEGKHFIDPSADPTSSVGDNSYIDNIRIADYKHVGLQEFSLTDVSVYPNPNSGEFFINIEAEKSGEAVLTLYDAIGKMIVQQTKDINSGANTWPVKIEAGAMGVYTLRLQMGEDILFKKLIIE